MTDDRAAPANPRGLSADYCYDRVALRGDYIRGALGLIFCLAGFALLGPSVVGWLFAAVGALFFYFLLRTLARQNTTYQLTGQGLRRSNKRRFPGAALSPPAHLPWDELSRVTLRYYSTKRDRSDGWMQMILKSRTTRLEIETTLNGFDDIARAAVLAALHNDVDISDSSLANFVARGISPGALRAAMEQGDA